MNTVMKVPFHVSIELMNRTGHCKFRLDCRTKRKKTTDAPLALPVHIPLDTVSVAIPLERLPLKISIPLEIVNRTHAWNGLMYFNLDG
ncbi:hypothetical protein EMCRGX_G007644 [Ephydatia muelleri]